MVFRLIISLPLIFFCLQTVSGQGPEASCCRLDVLAPLDPTILQVTVTNLEKQPVRVVRGAAELDLRIEIREENGRVPELTDYAKRLLVSGSRARILLSQSETVTQVLDLRKLYILNRGSYAVTVSRDVYIGERKIELQAKTTVKVP